MSDVVRGPDGQFMSADDAHPGRCDRHTTFTGYLSSTIPAADLTGQNGETVVTDDNSEVIDMGGHLDNDEVFVPSLIYMTAGYHMPTTSTEASSGALGYMLTTDLTEIEPAATWRGTFYGASNVEETDIVDVVDWSVSDASILFAGGLFANTQVVDDAQGSGAGGDVGHETTRIPLLAETGQQVTLDADDSLWIPHQLSYDGAQNHAVQASFAVHAYGAVYDVSDC